MNALTYLESRVAKKFAEQHAAQVATRPPYFAIPEDIDFGTAALAELPLGTTQFPAEQWVTWPNNRLVALTIVDRALDHELTNEQWLQVAFLMRYGGRERVA